MAVFSLSSVLRSRRGVVAIAVCLLLVLGGGAAFAVEGAPGSDHLPAWAEVYPSLELDEPTTEELVREGINEARQERGLATLTADETLTGVARNHSADMASRGFFNHTSPEGVGPETRVERSEATCTEVSENIVKLPRSNHEEPLAEDIVQAWLDSPGHLMNIVAENWSRTGVGVVANDDSVYVTQVFCE
jgi:uncharacterized protein YkwD